MTWIIDRIRMMFCKHVWDKGINIRQYSVIFSDDKPHYDYTYQRWVCVKCGFSKKVKV